MFNILPPGTPGRNALNESVNVMYSLFEGIASYIKWKSKTSSSLTANSIEKFSEKLDLWRTGGVYDVPDVEETLAEFNKINSCDGKTYVLQPGQCGDKSDCVDILSMPQYTVPDCVG